MTLFKTQKTAEMSTLFEENWFAYVKHATLWQRFSLDERQKILNTPVLKHIHHDVKSGKPMILMSPVIVDVLQSHNIDPQSLEHYNAIRFVQIWHQVGAVHVANPPSHKELAKRLADFVIERSFIITYSEESNNVYGYDAKVPTIDVSRITNPGRLRRLLSIPKGSDGAGWERIYASCANHVLTHLLSSVVVCRYVSTLLQRLIDHDGVMPLDLWMHLPENKSPNLAWDLARAVRALVLHMIVVIDYDTENACLRVGFWPGVLQKYLKVHNAENAVSLVVPEPLEVFTHTAFASDLAVVLADAYSQEMLVKANSSNELFAAVAKRMQPEFEKFPEWVTPTETYTVDIRLSVILDFALFMGLLKRKESPKNQLVITDAGVEMLKANQSERIQKIINLLREGERSQSRYESLQKWDFSSNLTEFYNTRSYQRAINIDQALCTVWAEMPKNAWVKADEWLDYVSWRRNPIELTLGKGVNCGYIGDESYYRNYITISVDAVGDRILPWMYRFLCLRLIYLGGVDCGRDAQQNLLIRMNDIGRFYINQNPTLLKIPEAESGRVVLQPNFELVFLGPNRMARATFGKFAEKISSPHETGTLFRLTKASVQNYLSAEQESVTVDAILDHLREFCGDSLPANVVAEMRAWASAQRTYFARPAIVLFLPDKVTTTLAHGILKRSYIANDTTLLLHEAVTTEQRKRLAKVGIFPSKRRITEGFTLPPETIS